MNRLFRRTLLAAALAFFAEASPSALAQSDAAGKGSIVKLFHEAATAASNATVRIRCDSQDAALGTVVDEKGLILTKGSELRGSVSVRLRDGREYDAEIVGYHEGSDLAMLKIKAEDLDAVKFVDAKVAEAGNMVAAPGMEERPVAAGIVSAGVRKLYREEAVVRNGNKGYLGIIIDRTRENDGLFIQDFANEQSPAKRAKILIGDQIVSIGDRTISKFDDLSATLDKFKPGDKIKVLVRRKIKESDDTEEVQVEVKLGTSGDRGDMQNKMGSKLSDRRTGFPQVITTDLVIEPRDCGGPLVDIDGRVLGITIARAGRVESWVLPKEVIQPIYAELKAGKHPKK